MFSLSVCICLPSIFLVVAVGSRDASRQTGLIGVVFVILIFWPTVNYQLVLRLVSHALRGGLLARISSRIIFFNTNIIKNN